VPAENADVDELGLMMGGKSLHQGGAPSHQGDTPTTDGQSTRTGTAV
jgi:hypothetical protein